MSQQEILNLKQALSATIIGQHGLRIARVESVVGFDRNTHNPLKHMLGPESQAQKGPDTRQLSGWLFGPRIGQHMQ